MIDTRTGAVPYDWSPGGVPFDRPEGAVPLEGVESLLDGAVPGQFYDIPYRPPLRSEFCLTRKVDGSQCGARPVAGRTLCVGHQRQFDAAQERAKTEGE